MLTKPTAGVWFIHGWESGFKVTHSLLPIQELKDVRWIRRSSIFHTHDSLQHTRYQRDVGLLPHSCAFWISLFPHSPTTGWNFFVFGQGRGGGVLKTHATSLVSNLELRMSKKGDKMSDVDRKSASKNNERFSSSADAFRSYSGKSKTNNEIQAKWIIFIQYDKMIKLGKKKILRHMVDWNVEEQWANTHKSIQVSNFWNYTFFTESIHWQRERALLQGPSPRQGLSVSEAPKSSSQNHYSVLFLG